MTHQFVGFLRGINVGGHHKLPMAELKKSLTELGFKEVLTLLNSGNFIFQCDDFNSNDLENKIEEVLLDKMGFFVPTIIRPSIEIIDLYNQKPFQNYDLTKDIRFYISFLKKSSPHLDLNLPRVSNNASFEIIDVVNKSILSVLNISVTKTPKAMSFLEKNYGKNITTRNWKTIERIVDKLKKP